MICGNDSEYAQWSEEEGAESGLGLSKNKKLEYYALADQGKRPTMEDYYDIQVRHTNTKGIKKIGMLKHFWLL